MTDHDDQDAGPGQDMETVIALTRELGMFAMGGLRFGAVLADLPSPVAAITTLHDGRVIVVADRRVDRDQLDQLVFAAGVLQGLDNRQ